MSVKDLPILGRWDDGLKRELGARELYYNLESFLRMESPQGIYYVLGRVKKLYPEYAAIYSELIRTLMAGEWVG